MSKGFAKSFTWGGFFSYSSSLLPEVKMIKKFLKYLQGLKHEEAIMLNSLPEKTMSDFWELPVVPDTGMHKGLSFSGTSMDIHIPHKYTRTSRN